MTKNMIIEELENIGYVVSEHKCIKNGVEMSGITIRKSETDKVAPVVYIDDILSTAEEKNMKLSEVVDDIIHMISQDFTFDISLLSDPEYIMRHVRIGVQEQGLELLVKRNSPFEGIEEYLYITDIHEEQRISVKITPQMIENIKLDADSLFDIAETNNHAEFKAEPLFDLASKMLGEKTYLDSDGLPDIFVISNRDNIKGASAMLDRKAIGEIADKIGVRDFILLPSSTHECILIPKYRDEDLEVFEKMVREVNSSVVDPMDKLIDRAYTITV